jgi:transposase
MTQTTSSVSTGHDPAAHDPAAPVSAVTGGVDTHGRTHHAAALDALGRVLGSAQFPATSAGYTALLAWLGAFGPVTKVGVEGTGSYGAGLTRHLHAAGITVVEVDRPDRKARRRHGKSDPIDAEAAARAALAGTATGTPKTRTGPVEAIRALRVARSGAVKARTAALNQLQALITTAPEPLRAALAGHRRAALLHACTALTQDPPSAEQLLDPATATRAALAAVAARVQALNTEIRLADQRLAVLVPRVAPRTSALLGVGPDTAGQLLATAGDNPHRIGTEAALAHLCGAAPIPASSGRRDRHRLNRGGDRQANRALHTIALVRLRYDPRTRNYMQRRTHDGLTKRDIIRCLKRYIAREIHTALLADLAQLTPCAP